MYFYVIEFLPFFLQFQYGLIHNIINFQYELHITCFLNKFLNVCAGIYGKYIQNI